LKVISEQQGIKFRELEQAANSIGELLILDF
jgi:hypothetical protein